MGINEYQRRASETAVYPEGDNLKLDNEIAQLMYLGSKLAGEAGEVSEKIAKLYRDKTFRRKNTLEVRYEDMDTFRSEVIKEMGDVLWYIAELSTKLDVDLTSVLEQNIRKLKSRQERGVLHGSGDNR